MGDKRIRDLLAELQQELQKKDVDSDTRELMTELESDIYSLLDAKSEQPESGSLLERAKALEASFATEYPAAERFMREMIDALVRMGI